MYSVKRLFAVCLALLMLLMASASAEIPFLVHSQGWQMENTPVEVVLKAAVEALQRELVTEAVHREGSLRKAAAALDMDATTLGRLAKKLGVELS